MYATVFGIAEKVIKQLKIVYPNFEEMSSEITTYRYMDLMIRTDFSSSFSHAISSSISSSISSTYSSGSGSGGGFSGGGGFGGGGGRRRWKINSLIYIVFVKFLIVLINSHFTDGGCKTSSAITIFDRLKNN